VNLTKFNKARCKILHLGQGSPLYQYRLGDELIESRLQRELGITVDEKLDMSQQFSCNPLSQSYSGLHKEKHAQQVEGGNSPILVSEQ